MDCKGKDSWHVNPGQIVIFFKGIEKIEARVKAQDKVAAKTHNKKFSKKAGQTHSCSGSNKGTNCLLRGKNKGHCLDESRTLQAPSQEGRS